MIQIARWLFIKEIVPKFRAKNSSDHDVNGQSISNLQCLFFSVFDRALAEIAKKNIFKNLESENESQGKEETVPLDWPL